MRCFQLILALTLAVNTNAYAADNSRGKEAAAFFSNEFISLMKVSMFKLFPLHQRSAEA
jgi:hypothetical protein